MNPSNEQVGDRGDVLTPNLSVTQSETAASVQIMAYGATPEANNYALHLSSDADRIYIVPAPSMSVQMTMTGTAGLQIVVPTGTWTVNRDGIWFGNDCKIDKDKVAIADLPTTGNAVDTVAQKVNELLNIFRTTHVLLS